MLFKLLAAPGETEPWMADLLAQLMPARHGLFVDVGVNLGQTLTKVKAIEPGRPYLGFEPNPACVAFTEQLIESRSFRDCRIIPAGLAANTGVAELEIPSTSPLGSAGSTVPGFRPSERIRIRKAVVLLALDSLPADIFAPPVAFVKIDVEGGELEVLQTLLPIIERDRPIIIIEILPCYSADRTERVARQEATEALLAGCGYRLERVVKTSDDRFETLDPVERIGIHGDLALCDYVARA